MKPFTTLFTPALVIDQKRLEQNLLRMQKSCQAAGIQLWPHIKTHKCVAIARRQLALGATGLTCAKLSEAEALLPSGVRKLFLAHSLASSTALQRAAVLQQKVDEMVLAVTSLAHGKFLARLADEAHLSFPVAIAVDTGLGREGLRTQEEAAELIQFLRHHAALRPIAIYTHEGQAYSAPKEKRIELIEKVFDRLVKFRRVLGENLALWPGCSTTAHDFINRGGIEAVRPGAYVFGDLYLSEITGSMSRDDVALTVRSSVVDRPGPDLALIDAGSKTFSSDHLPNGIFARPWDGRDIGVTRLSEEHGFVTGSAVNELQIGEVIDWIPAHVCPAVNLARELVVKRTDGETKIWPIEASGCNY